MVKKNVWQGFGWKNQIKIGFKGDVSCILTKKMRNNTILETFWKSKNLSSHKFYEIRTAPLFLFIRKSLIYLFPTIQTFYKMIHSKWNTFFFVISFNTKFVLAKHFSLSTFWWWIKLYIYAIMNFIIMIPTCPHWD